MLRSLFNLILSAALLGAGFLLPHSLFDVSLEQPASAQAAALVAEQAAAQIPAKNAEAPLAVAAGPQAPERDPLGEVYFTLGHFFSDEPAFNLVRLPGSCVVGLEACPEPEVVDTPFAMQDVNANKAGGVAWSPDGKLGVLVTHPEDELSRGRSSEELETLKTQSPAGLQISPSTIYVFDAESESWQEIYRVERKYIYEPFWSPDGQWLAFAVRSSVWAFHPLQADDGIYVIRPDGSDLRQLSAEEAGILGWLGNGILLQHVLAPYPATAYAIDLLTLDGEVKSLFQSERSAYYNLAPDGSALLVSDAQGESAHSPQKAVDLLALEGSILHSYGTFSNQSASIFSTAWSDDGVQIAFASLRRVYVSPRGGNPREVYVADDTFVQPTIWQMQFSPDQQHLLLDVYDGVPRFVSVALDGGEATQVTWPGLNLDYQARNFSWRP